MISHLATFERTSCSCRQCLAPCTSGKPGALAPSDLDHIAEHIGLDEASEEFIQKMFTAGEDRRIRPRARENKTCVFLSEDGEHRCTVHAAAPFECSRVDLCRPEDGREAMTQLAIAIEKSADYSEMWKWLKRQQDQGVVS